MKIYAVKAYPRGIGNNESASYEVTVGHALTFRRAKKIAREGTVEGEFWTIDEYRMGKIDPLVPRRTAFSVDLRHGNKIFPAGTLIPSLYPSECESLVDATRKVS